MGTQLVGWNRYGKRRTYVNDDDGSSLGYRDEATGEVYVAVAERADDVRRALAAPVRTARVPGPSAAARPATADPATARPATADPERVRRRRAALAAGRAHRSWAAPTLSEKVLADELRRSSPYAWQREVPFDPYRLDFYCAAARLAVEVDGGSHRGRAERDAHRDAHFRDLGIETLRVSAGMVEHDPAAVVAHINRACVARTGAVPPTAVPAPGMLARLLGRTAPVTRPPLAPEVYAGQRQGGRFVCARCREERTAAARSRRATSCCTTCAP